ncbi:hypothetical protein NDU88_000372 [Pleurodeles waltl]|uniref:Ig-like domain-containing protein n=1 Tax=Pleurodeles waltl TaxID=8319 RepID=A0AAV7P405_PLEWA|nr:hypothetical protein NDU88_000372 [Pleurodeles waltl]
MARVCSLAAFLCLAKWSDAAVHQSQYEVRRTGQAAELQCHQDEAHPNMFWYRQTPGAGLQLVFYSVGAGCSDAAVLQAPFLAGRAGGSATLRCDQDNNHNVMYWYQQQRGQALKMLCYSLAQSDVQAEASTPDRVSASRPEVKSFSLNIRDLTLNDSAMYFCASSPDTAL